jgi:hypothetical protein
MSIRRTDSAPQYTEQVRVRHKIHVPLTPFNGDQFELRQNVLAQCQHKLERHRLFAHFVRMLGVYVGATEWAETRTIFTHCDFSKKKKLVTSVSWSWPNKETGGTVHARVLCGLQANNVGAYSCMCKDVH